MDLLCKRPTIKVYATVPLDFKRIDHWTPSEIVRACEASKADFQPEELIGTLLARYTESCWVETRHGRAMIDASHVRIESTSSHKK